jgi:hypothetical protein
MVIGIVLNLLEEENQKHCAEQDKENRNVSWRKYMQN